jgi:hypothetical protein
MAKAGSTIAILTAALIAGSTGLAFAQASGGASNTGTATPGTTGVNGQFNNQSGLNNRPCGTGGVAQTGSASTGTGGSSTPGTTGVGSTTTGNTNEAEGARSSTPSGLSSGTSAGAGTSGC